MRFYLIGRYTLAIPIWDQWDGEGAVLIKPYLEGTLRWPALWAPHNEHRIFLTRLLALTLLRVNGQWDGQLEMAVNAVFWALSAVGIAGAALSGFAGRFRRTILLAVGLFFVLPFGWENTLAGFQSQNYFLILFSLAAIWGFVDRRTGSARWLAGPVGAGLACLSMATGFLAGAAVLGLLGLRWGRERRRPIPGETWTALLCSGIVVFGLLTRVEVPGHVGLRAESWSALVLATARFLAWPLCGLPALGLLALIPPLLLCARYLRRRPANPAASPGRELPLTELLLAVSLWGLLQTVALAYGRGGHGALPACRYMDLLGVVALVNFFVWLALFVRARRRGERLAVAAGAALWLWPLLAGLRAETTRDFTAWLPESAREFRERERNTRGYLASHDFARFLAGKPLLDLPYPDPVRLAALLDDPALQRVFPAGIRRPLAVRPDAEAAPSAFAPGRYDPACGVPPGEKVWGSYGGKTLPGPGVFRARLLAPATLPYLRFSFAGYLGEPGLGFSLRDVPGRRQVDWRPARPPREHWHPDDVPNPSRALRLEATDASARWFAFGEPVEVGAWSHWTGFFLRRWGWFLSAGLLLGGGVELAAGLSRRLARSRLPLASAAASPAASPRAPLRLLSVVIPARDEEKSLPETVRQLHAELRRSEVPHEILVVDDGSTDRTREVLAGLTRSVPTLRPLDNFGSHGFGRAITYGLAHMRGDAAVIVMADASDSPRDVVRYWHTLQAGYDCVFGSRFVRGSRVVDYPAAKRVFNRLANLCIRLLFNVACNDVTNAFKAYRREAIAGCQPLISAHFNLTAELPLKAMVRGYRWKVVPVSWQNRRAGATKFKLKEMGSRYLFICGCVWLEKHLGRGDYHRGPSPEGLGTSPDPDQAQ